MKLACIINAWDGCELLRASMLSMKSQVDIFIIVFQNISNYGEHYSPLGDMDLRGFNYVLRLYTPDTIAGAKNETAKRNLGIQAAREIGCTHFLLCDVDEAYENFDNAVKQYKNSGKDGSFCKIYTYFKLPTLRFADFDDYFVPFIHKLHPNTEAGGRKYPVYVDPTRRINCTDVVMIDESMHHFSYVRKNIDRKCRNSSAKANIERSQLLSDYHSPDVGPGFFVKDFKQSLIEVPNIFNIDVESWHQDT